jgi:hypothetical protein
MLLVVIPLRQLVLILISKVSHSHLTRPKCELVGEVGGGGLGADMPVVGVPAREDAPLLGVVVMGVITVVMGVVNAEAPVTEFLKWTLLL